MSLSDLAPAELALLDGARRAVLATIRPDGSPRLVPIVYATDVAAGRIYSPLDQKRKSISDPRRLARARDIAARPQASVLVDRWSEDWSALGWLRLDGRAELLEPHDAANSAEHETAVRLLEERYPQYAGHELARRPIIRLTVERTASWAAV
ncbi:MAG TPA: TIGR03668 family PPOX class F420-dependent oxidoreductase [Candidatus Limnocylindrales bacterium]|jgi:PPOX class probable F420-dependent enzyme|nr:TIGR03668 family PPOX class F420-dependent oxidoreductase [Candidatus Limnocylindrales bacterium]